MNIAYFLDQNDFSIKDVVELQDAKIIIDEETNKNTEISVVKKLDAIKGDIICIKEDNNDITYLGVISSPINENGSNKFTLTAKYITNIFDRSIFLENEQLIKNTGIEDFIKYTIENEFTKTEDALLNKSYIEVEVLTHTPIQKSVRLDEGVYNFHTYMTNATQLYGITYKFEIIGKKLKIKIQKETEKQAIFDTTISDITDYLEAFEENYTAKVNVKAESGQTHTLYLLNNKTTTTNMNDPNRVLGTVVNRYVQNESDLTQTALDVMAGNRYNHLIQFKINRFSKLFDTSKLKVGMLFKIKSKEGIVYDTYLSCITRQIDSNFIELKFGNTRIDFIDKLNQERKVF